jgi:uncharacterized protein YceH (UPF0502 family)
VNADPVELRVLGCLIEKQRTTPDQYPLSLNALRLACNQATNRDPVVDYDETTIRAALQRLRDRGWTRLASNQSSRATKYRHLFDEAVGVSDGEISLLAVLMLRGAQTVGELKQRTERMHRFESLADVEETLAGLERRELIARLPRRPGQSQDRFEHLLGGDEPAPAPAPEEPTSAPAPDSIDERVRHLEEEVAALRAEVIALRDRLPD